MSEFEATIFSKADGPLTKLIALDEAGAIRSDGSACIMSQGTARRLRFADLQPFADILERLGSDEALALGRLRNGLADEVPVVSKKMLRDNPGAIARTQEFLAYEKGAQALALIDFDQKGMLEAVRAKLDENGGLWASLVLVMPRLTDVGHVLRRSTSAGLYRTDTGEEFAGSGGVHAFITVRDGSDIERFLTDLHARCWLADLGWLMVGAGGQLLERSIVDRVVGTPERLVFEGAPVLVPPLAQNPVGRRPSVVESGLLDTVATCPPLSIKEDALFRELRAKAAAALSFPARDARRAFVQEHKARLIARGIEPAAAPRAIDRQCDGILQPSVVLPFDDPELANKTVADVLADPNRFEGETLADPLEGIEYGTGKAKVMLHGDGTPWINSFAHGRTVYELRFDYALAASGVAQAPREQVVAAFVRFVLDGDLGDDEIEQLRDIAADRAGVGKRAVMARLKSARKERDAKRAEEQRTQRIASRTDPRLQVSAPAFDAPWLPQMELLEEVLGADPSDEPPMRDDDGYVIEAHERVVSGLHELTAAGSNATEKKETWLPPPAQLLLGRLDRASLGEMIERHIDYVDPTDASRSVHLHTAFVDHYLKRRRSILPIARSVTSLPLVLPDGSIAAGPGLDRRLGIVFRVPRALRELLPHPERCSSAACARALRFLTHEWLCDVATDYAGRCTIVATAASIIERGMLPERPAFFITAGQRGGGKTTVANMISCAVLGHRAAAAAWSPNDEERRKALLAYLSAGVPFLVWDNIPRGAAIGCPSIEKALTAETYCDRVLGVSDYITVPAQTIHDFTGNNISGRGDLASRILGTHIDVSRPDPENRPFEHPDPIGWTQANRGKILRALYVILLGNPRRWRNDLGPAKTRFKVWWDLVGSAVEYAAQQHVEQIHYFVADREPSCPPAPVDFAARFMASEAGDEQGLGLATVLDTLRRRYAAGMFTAAEVATFAGRAEDEAVAFKGGLEMASGKALPIISAISVASRLKSLVDAPVALDDATVALRYKPHHQGGSFFIAPITVA